MKKIRIHSFETLGAHDGPGLRTVVFFQGCPMKCLYCHNPDMLECGKNGKDYLIEEVVAFCKKYKLYHGENGGVTLSGGEPLMQAEGVLELIRELKKEGFRVCLDTGGGVKINDTVKRILNEIDFILFDIKHTDPEKHLELTGQPIEYMMNVLNYIKTIKKAFYVRQVIVPGFTDDETQIKKLKKLAEGAMKIELLPYHTLGIEKWLKLGMDYKLKEFTPPSKELMKKLEEIVS